MTLDELHRRGLGLPQDVLPVVELEHLAGTVTQNPGEQVRKRRVGSGQRRLRNQQHRDRGNTDVNRSRDDGTDERCARDRSGGVMDPPCRDHGAFDPQHGEESLGGRAPQGIK